MRLGNCEIKIQSIHPRQHEDEGSYMIAPDEFREMAGRFTTFVRSEYQVMLSIRITAGWVIRSCVLGAPNVGGFATRNVSNVIDYLATSSGNLSPQAYRMQFHIMGFFV